MNIAAQKIKDNLESYDLFLPCICGNANTIALEPHEVRCLRCLRRVYVPTPGLSMNEIDLENAAMQWNCFIVHEIIEEFKKTASIKFSVEPEIEENENKE